MHLNITQYISLKTPPLPNVLCKSVVSVFTPGSSKAIFSTCLYHCTIFLLPFTLQAQFPTTLSNIAEQQLEAITEKNEDIETEDDSFLQSMRQYSINPINLNIADITSLTELMIFSPIQIQSIISYRKLLGNFINIYELQAVPGLDLPFIEKIRPYITVTSVQPLLHTMVDRLFGGQSGILIRASQLLEKQRGFRIDPATANNYYMGSRQKLLVRYKYQFKNLLQYGIVGEKDAGEQFFKGAQKKGFDFYAVHLFARNVGNIKALALGDFTVNLGQGLTQGQGLAFKKGADIPNIKRQLAILRPYNSSGEINFHRGMGITIAKNTMTATGFLSYKKIDANFKEDTINMEHYISSLQTSGFHRTKSEIADKGVQRQFTAGGNIAYHSKSFHVGINGVHYHFNYPIKKSEEPYNLFAISGKRFGNYSVDYSYGYRNLHFFGEAAITNRFEKAFVSGLIASVDSKVDMSFLYRNISKKYQSLYTSSFTEGSYPTNEKGMFAGISVRPHTFWRIDAYADFYKFPWLKYQVDAPSTGKDYLMQVSYRPNKQLEMYLRYRTEIKSKNHPSNDWIIAPVADKPKQNLRSHLEYKLNSSLSFRTRIELAWYDQSDVGSQHGFLTFFTCIIHPMMKKYSASIRLQYFETDGYDSRIYAYENDVLYSFSIPVFYDKGYRYYINYHYNVNKKLAIWLRWSQTIYKGKDLIGSGLDEIEGNKRSELKLQVQYIF